MSSALYWRSVSLYTWPLPRLDESLAACHTYLQHVNSSAAAFIHVTLLTLIRMGRTTQGEGERERKKDNGEVGVKRGGQGDGVRRETGEKKKEVEKETDRRKNRRTDNQAETHQEAAAETATANKTLPHDRRVGTKGTSMAYASTRQVVVVVVLLLLVMMMWGVGFSAVGRSDAMMIRCFIHTTLELALWLLPDRTRQSKEASRIARSPTRFSPFACRSIGII